MGKPIECKLMSYDRPDEGGYAILEEAYSDPWLYGAPIDTGSCKSVSIEGGCGPNALTSKDGLIVVESVVDAV